MNIQKQIVKNTYSNFKDIDFDKHTDQILLANEKLSKKNQVTICGAKNDLYVYHHIK